MKAVSVLFSIAVFGCRKKESGMKFICILELTLIVGLGATFSAAAQPVKLGSGSYFLSPKGADKAPPKAFNGY